jgi:hypothetical protein
MEFVGNPNPFNSIDTVYPLIFLQKKKMLPFHFAQHLNQVFSAEQLYDLRVDLNAGCPVFWQLIFHFPLRSFSPRFKHP